MLFYMLLDTQVAHTEVCLYMCASVHAVVFFFCFLLLSAVLFLSFGDECSSSDASSLSVFRTLLHDNPPCGCVCVYVHTRGNVCVYSGGGVPLFVGVCVFKNVSEDGSSCSYSSVCLRVRDGESERGATASVQL